MDNASAVTDQFSTRDIHLNISALNAMSLIFWQNKKKYFSFRESQITRNIHLCMMIKISRESSSALVNLNSGRHESPLENSVTIFYWIFLSLNWTLNHYNSDQPDEHLGSPPLLLLSSGHDSRSETLESLHLPHCPPLSRHSRNLKSNLCNILFFKKLLIRTSTKSNCSGDIRVI